MTRGTQRWLRFLVRWSHSARARAAAAPKEPAARRAAPHPVSPGEDLRRRRVHGAGGAAQPAHRPRSHAAAGPHTPPAAPMRPAGRPRTHRPRHRPARHRRPDSRRRSTAPHGAYRPVPPPGFYRLPQPPQLPPAAARSAPVYQRHRPLRQSAASWRCLTSECTRTRARRHRTYFSGLPPGHADRWAHQRARFR